jgi:3-(3-hydroxy-phenyl)propionate hydroxylase
VFFIGDAAHVVSPFGARGGNTGIQDAANLAWKFALVLGGRADATLLDSYDAERRPAAEKNLEVTSRSARFLAPRSKAEHVMRHAVVALAKRHAFARGLVNTGRMSVANDYPSAPHLPEGSRTVQNVALRAAGGATTTLAQLLREGTHGLVLWRAPSAADAEAMSTALAGLPVRLVALGGSSGLTAFEAGEAELAHLDLATPGSLLLVRPDGYRAARLAAPTPAAVAAAVRTAFALN